ncbi:MEDS domain-containing protein [Jeotgalibacillus terrae]|uniref:MEDS domain-containing protein n=1 Tax=Jeotgalibacillus terrae TaxID=587735 RepID=A0ABW5ZFQ0_9BACL|nr:MEDS domain-containing protein [Jeotgalibacillus terrae]MBM7579425.1 acyl carrier protein [Jeotgalibacillus terrae]
MKHSLPDLIEAQRNVHVLYSYGEREIYLQTVLTYILDSISAKEMIVLIENERNFRQLMIRLKKLVSVEQLEYVHFINSFDFYFSSGDYNPSSITAYFEKEIEPYLNNKKPFRSWAHVEWNSSDMPYELIHSLEKTIDETVNQIGFPLICAYKKTDMPASLHSILIQSHPYILSENMLSPDCEQLIVKPNMVNSEQNG